MAHGPHGILEVGIMADAICSLLTFGGLHNITSLVVDCI